MTLRDIRELAGDPQAYAAELQRRWTGLLSYRYIGRNHGSMNTGPADNTVTLRRDMRNAAGGLLVAPLSISAPEGDVGSDLVAVPNPVIHSCQILDGPGLPPLWQAFGARPRADGHWGMPELTADLASPDAALHIGPQHVLLETAAISYAADLAGTDRLQMRSWHVMFLARAKAGPFRVDGEAIAGTGRTVAARLALHDEGNGDRLVTSASAVFEIA